MSKAIYIVASIIYGASLAIALVGWLVVILASGGVAVVEIAFYFSLIAFVSYVLTKTLEPRDGK